MKFEFYLVGVYMKKLIKNIVQNKKFPKNFLTYERVHVGIYLVLLLLICVFSIHTLFGKNPNPMVTKVFNIIVLSLIIVLLFFANKMSIFIFKRFFKIDKTSYGWGLYKS
jgi:membrane protein YdbS with pleckstrin-like domain